ncbi:hypothetical protein GJV07_02060 [Enterobacteriaceae bacterium RIT711]|nr:hypothetical protein [Enterobacteriaceae bacterium RIT711]
MKKLMLAIEDLNHAQLALLKRWQETYFTMEQQNNLLSQQVDYLEGKIAELERKLYWREIKDS